MSTLETKQKIKELLVGLTIYEISELLQDLRIEIKKDCLYSLPVSK